MSINRHGEEIGGDESFMRAVARARAIREANRGSSQLDGRNGWTKLIEKGQIGRTTTVQYKPLTDGGSLNQNVPNDLLSVGGDSADALQLCLTLAPPMLVPTPASFVAGTTQISTGQDNFSLPGVNGAAGATAFANSVALIEWGIGGVKCAAECDFSNGLCLNLQASYVNVRAKMELTNQLVQNALYTFGAFLGPGNAKPNNAQRTVDVTQPGQLAVDVESPVFPVPRFAKAVRVIGANAAHDLCVADLRFYRSIGGTVDDFRMGDYTFAGNTPNSFHVPGGAYYFTVVSRMPGPSLFYAIFDLAI